MPRQSQHPKEESFNFRIDPQLKAVFQTATEERAFAAEAERQSRVLAARAADPRTDEAEIIRRIEDVTDADGWTA